jgi:putative redox protein
MSTATVHWVREKQFAGIDANHHAVVMSGYDSAQAGRPSQMLLIGLAACTGYDVLDIMDKSRTPLNLLEITASGSNDSEPSWPFRSIHLRYRVRGENLKKKTIAQAIALSQEKYCAVASSVRGVAEITSEYEILP